MKIVAITGKAKVGKDTFAKKFQNYLGNNKVFTIAYADMLKVIVTRNFGYRGIKDEKDRKILQSVGDLFRGVDKNFFINIVVNMLNTIEKLGYDYFVITDARFDNEVECLFNKGYKVIVVRLLRDITDGLKGITAKHISERGISDNLVDITIELENNIDYNIENYISRIMGDTIE